MKKVVNSREVLLLTTLLFLTSILLILSIDFFSALTLSATPQYCTNFNSNNLCTSTVSISGATSTDYAIVVYTSSNPTKNLFACNRGNFNQQASWISKGKSYTFEAYQLTNGASCISSPSTIMSHLGTKITGFSVYGSSPNPCTSFSYSDWGACKPDNTQARTILSSSPSGCVDGSPQLTRACDFFNSTKLTSLGKEIGVDYHAIGTNYAKDAFLVRYNSSEVREEVRRQLIVMKQRGITTISTRIWLNWVNPNPTYFNGTYYHHHLPITEQEAANLRQYVQDVADIGGLNLSFDLLYGGWYVQEIKIATGCSNQDCPVDKTFPSSQLVSAYKTSIDKIINSVSDITNKDGTKTVNKIYLDGEVVTTNPPIDNYSSAFHRWFMKDSGLYAYLLSKASAAGIEPATYFWLYVYSDADTYLYNTLKYFKDNSIPIPDRIDISFYTGLSPNPSNAVNSFFNELDKNLAKNAGKNVKYYIQETDYQSDPVSGLRSLQAWRDNFYRANFTGVNFWTTPIDFTNPSTADSINLDILYENNPIGFIGSYINYSSCNNNICTAILSAKMIPSSIPMVVTVELEGKRSIMACIASGQIINAPWIVKGKTYTFNVYKDSSKLCLNSQLKDSDKLTSIILKIPIN